MRRLVAFAALFGPLILLSCGGSDSSDPTDNTDPSITILEPADDATVSASIVTIRANATDNEAVSKVEFYVNAAKIGEDSSGDAGTYELGWNAAGLPAGSRYTIRVRAIDTSSNDADASIQVRIASLTGPTYHSGEILVSERWRASGNPHIVQNGLGIDGGATLTIDPGCIVRVDPENGFTVGWTNGGAIFAIGKPDSLIVFTSNKTPAERGDWFGFGFNGGTLATTRLSYCVIEFGGYELGTAINLDWGAIVRLDHTTIRNSAGFGITYDHEGHVSNFSDNTITGCANYPMEIAAGDVTYLGTGNSFSGNDYGYDAILIDQDVIDADAIWRDQETPYRVREGNLVAVAGESEPVLTILAGTTIEFQANSGLSIGYSLPGRLSADGADSLITFTSASVSPEPGDWIGIYLANSDSRLRDCAVEYGGANGDGAIVIDTSSPDVRDNTISNSSAWGIYLAGDGVPDAGTLESQNTFSNCASGNVYQP
jgi:parallel beta-helix repeat protein